MAAEFQEVSLDTSNSDDHAVLVLRDGRLTAVLTRLSAMHGEWEGMWFVEAMFSSAPFKIERVFAIPEEFVAWLDEEDRSQTGSTHG